MGGQNENGRPSCFIPCTIQRRRKTILRTRCHTQRQNLHFALSHLDNASRVYIFFLHSLYIHYRQGMLNIQCIHKRNYILSSCVIDHFLSLFVLLYRSDRNTGNLSQLTLTEATSFSIHPKISTKSCTLSYFIYSVYKMHDIHFVVFIIH